MGADILERLEADAKVWPRSRDLMTEAAAEIGRLRGEVAMTEQQKADRDLLLTGTSFMRDGKRIDPATVRIETPAPAMPNGVEGLVAKWRGEAAQIKDEDEYSNGMRETLLADAGELEEALRAADNRDAAGVEARRHAANEWADMATNGVQWLRNIRDGVSTVDEALAEMESNIVRVRALNDAAQAAPAAVPAGEAVAFPMDTAPRDGTMVRLLVSFTEHATEDSPDPSWTIGANNFDHDGEDRWLFAGWCWTHDHFTQGQGTPVGWLPMLGTTPQPADGEAVTAALAEWFAKEMPAGTVIGDPSWWAGKLSRHLALRQLVRAIEADTPPAPVQAAPQEGEVGRVCGYTPGMGRVEIQLEGNLPDWLELGQPVHVSAFQHRGDSRGGEG